MKPEHIYKILLLTLILFSSCISTRKLIRKSSTVFSEFSVNKLNGIYSNGNKTSEENNLWYVLTKYKESDSFNVKITLLKEQILNIKLINQDSILEEYNLLGKIKNQYFSIDRDLKLIPFYPIYYIRNEQKTVLGNDKDGNLILIKRNESEGAILFLGNGNYRTNEYKFEKIKN